MNASNVRARLLIALITTMLATPVLANDAGRWKTLQRQETCIGGSRCGGYVDTLRLATAPRPIAAVRFYAHDDVGRHFNGRLRIEIGRQIIADGISITRRGRWHEVDAHGARGRDLTLTALANDEVVVRDVEVLYAGRGASDRGPREGSLNRHGDQWRTVSDGACIGGRQCRDRNGDFLEVALSGRPVHGVRFFAHDQVAGIARGALRVRLGHRVLEPRLEIDDHGRWYHLEIGGVPARYLTFEAAANDEVVIEQIEVLYGRGRTDRDRSPRGRGTSLWFPDRR